MVRSGYEKLMGAVLSRRLYVVAALLVLVAVRLAELSACGLRLHAAHGRRRLRTGLLGAAGDSLTESDRLLRQVEAILLATPEVEPIPAARASNWAAASPRQIRGISS